MNNRPYETEAATFCEAIRNLAKNPEALDNLQSYLEMHFAPWLEKFANTPEGIAAELEDFSGICELPF